MSQVKYFHSAMSGAPVLSGQAGALIAVLDACLKDGFGLVTLDSLVVDSNEATASRAAGIGFEVDQVIRIAGATPSSLNGDWRVTAVSSTWAKFATSGIADQTATGTITAKAAPLDWTKPYSATNKAAYLMPDGDSTQCCLRVDDTNAQPGYVRGYKAMTDVDTGTDPFPTTAQLANGANWHKSSAASSASRPWLLVGDGKGFYFFQDWNADGKYSSGYFGDMESFRAGDAYHCLLIGQSATAPTAEYSSGQLGELFHNNSDGWSYSGRYVCRGSNQSGGALPAGLFGSILSAGMGAVDWTRGNYWSSSAWPGTASHQYPRVGYPNPADSRLICNRDILVVDVFDTGSTPAAAGMDTLRGRMRGLLQPLQRVDSIAHLGKVGNVVGLETRTIMLAAIASGNSTFQAAGRAAIDITGPW